MRGAFHDPLCEVWPSSVFRMELLLPRKRTRGPPICKVVFPQRFGRSELTLHESDMTLMISHGLVQPLLHAEAMHKLYALRQLESS